MSLKTVILFAALSGLVVLAYTLGLHTYLIPADPSEQRIACRQLCTLKVQEGAGGEGVLADLAGLVGRSGCEAALETPLLDGCVERANALGLTVADYRCVMRAGTLAEATACGDSIPR